MVITAMYILDCSDGTYYVGSAYDMKRRIAEHKRGEGARYTRKRLPVRLVYFEDYLSVEDAFNREQQIKKWSAKKKRALIDRDIQKLKRLSNA